MLPAIKPMLTTGVGMFAATAVIAAVPMIPAGHDLAVGRMSPVSESVALLSNSQQLVQSDSPTGLAGAIKLLTAIITQNQILVQQIASHTPAGSVGPIAIGGGLLANAYYSGYQGSKAGIPGILAYVASQLHSAHPAASIKAGGTNLPPALLKALILSATAKTPTSQIGPVTVGGGVLAHAYFDGYNGSPTGLPGVISYVRHEIRTPKSSAASTAPSAAALTAAANTPKSAASKKRVANAAAATRTGR